MFTYRGTANCVLSDGTSVPVSVSITSEPGLLDSIVGTAISRNFPTSYLNETEVILQLPDGRAQKFMIKNVVGTTQLELVSNGDWLAN